MVWCSNHIADTACYKATATYADAIANLIADLVEATRGDWVDIRVPVGNPPLDHEDGKVYATCRRIEDTHPIDQVLCVTNDRKFIEYGRARSRPGMVRIMSPRRFTELLHAADMRAMRPTTR